MTQWKLLIALLGFSSYSAQAVECIYNGREDSVKLKMAEFLNSRPDRLFDVAPDFPFADLSGAAPGTYIVLGGKKVVDRATGAFGVYFGFGVCNPSTGQFVPVTGLFKTKEKITYDELLPLGECQGQEEEMKKNVLTQVQDQITSSQKNIKVKMEDFGFLWPVSFYQAEFHGVVFAGVAMSENGKDLWFFEGNGICFQGSLIPNDMNGGELK